MALHGDELPQVPLQFAVFPIQSRSGKLHGTPHAARVEATAAAKNKSKGRTRGTVTPATNEKAAAHAMTRERAPVVALQCAISRRGTAESRILAAMPSLNTVRGEKKST